MIYLDNCSTTKPRKEVISAMTDALTMDFGNPSSLHRLGLITEKKIKEARETISSYLKVDSKEIYFTSGGTESNNIALQSIIKKFTRKGKHIITSNIEHASIMNVLKHYEAEGYDISYLKVDELGYINLEELKNTIREDTILVSIIHVNNEIGVVQNIKEIKRIIDKSKSKPLLHLDGVQSFGKIDFSLKNLGVDSYSFSGHKVHGPKGIGGLYINSALKLNPIIFGGNQESGLRSGTENVPGIIGIGEAVRTLLSNGDNDRTHVQSLKEHFADRIKKEIDDVKINTPLDDSASPYIISISFDDVRGEVLLHYLEDKEIYVSTSSACSSKGTTKSHVLRAIKLSDKEIEGTIRFCFSYEISKKDIDKTLEVLKTSIDEIRDIIRR